MIRPAELSDIPALLEMGKRFADKGGVSATYGWDDDSVASLFAHLIESPDGLLLVAPQSMFGGVFFPHPYNNAMRVFQELFWWSEGRCGLALLAEAERLARDGGAERFVMGGLQQMPSVDRLYARRGFAPAEKLFVKEI